MSLTDRTPLKQVEKEKKPFTIVTTYTREEPTGVEPERKHLHRSKTSVHRTQQRLVFTGANMVESLRIMPQLQKQVDEKLLKADKEGIITPLLVAFLLVQQRPYRVIEDPYLFESDEDQVAELGKWI